MQSDSSAKGEFTHVITRDEVYYLGSPAQASPPDGTFKAGTKVSLVSDNGSYSRVTSEDDISAWVATDALKPLGSDKA